MRAKRLLKLQVHSSGPLPSPSEGETEVLVRKLESQASAGNARSLGVLGLIIFGAYAGIRPKEARLANYKDLNTLDRTLVFLHPKGEESWDRPRQSKIISAGRPAIERFLQMRRTELLRRGIAESQDLPLVPRFRANGTISHWSSTYALQVKRRLEELLGQSFGFQTERRTFGQNALDWDVGLDSASGALGHRSTLTTERSYARRRGTCVRRLRGSLVFENLNSC
jgi:integrase